MSGIEETGVRSQETGAVFRIRHFCESGGDKEFVRRRGKTTLLARLREHAKRQNCRKLVQVAGAFFSPRQFDSF
jgi:hypothetical protein